MAEGHSLHLFPPVVGLAREASHFFSNSACAPRHRRPDISVHPHCCYSRKGLIAALSSSLLIDLHHWQEMDALMTTRNKGVLLNYATRCKKEGLEKRIGSGKKRGKSAESPWLQWRTRVKQADENGDPNSGGG